MLAGQTENLPLNCSNCSRLGSNESVRRVKMPRRGIVLFDDKANDSKPRGWLCVKWFYATFKLHL